MNDHIVFIDAYEAGLARGLNDAREKIERFAAALEVRGATDVKPEGGNRHERRKLAAQRRREAKRRRPVATVYMRGVGGWVRIGTMTDPPCDAEQSG